MKCFVLMFYRLRSILVCMEQSCGSYGMFAEPVAIGRYYNRTRSNTFQNPPHLSHLDFRDGFIFIFNCVRVVR